MKRDKPSATASLRTLAHHYRSLICDTDRAILPLLDSINVADLARHNAGYKQYDVDRQKTFVENEKGRFLKAIAWLNECTPNRQVCDFGCFIPYLPVALSRLGYRVKIVDKYSLYGPAFKDSIQRLAESCGMEVFDCDILQDDFTPLGRNDVALLMAVVEHLNGTPSKLMKAVHHTIKGNGKLIFEVPNIASLSRRIRLLLGRSPLPDYVTYYSSTYPFMGHNREMTVSEVRYLLEHTGFSIDRIDCYDYHLRRPENVKDWVRCFVTCITPLPNKGASIMALARPHACTVPPESAEVTK